MQKNSQKLLTSALCCDKVNSFPMKSAEALQPSVEEVPENPVRVPKVQGGLPPNLSGKRTDQT